MAVAAYVFAWSDTLNVPLYASLFTHMPTDEAGQIERQPEETMNLILFGGEHDLPCWRAHSIQRNFVKRFYVTLAERSCYFGCYRNLFF